MTVKRKSKAVQAQDLRMVSEYLDALDHHLTLAHGYERNGDPEMASAHLDSALECEGYAEAIVASY